MALKYTLTLLVVTLLSSTEILVKGNISKPFVPRTIIQSGSYYEQYTTTKTPTTIDIDAISQRTFLTTRGGAYYANEYDEYDGYDDEYDDNHDQHDARSSNRRPPPPPPRNRSNRPPPPRRRPPPPNSRSSRKKQPPVSSAILSSTADFASKSLNMATTATVSTLKTSGRAAYYLTAPKHVHKDEIYGIWRFDQCIGSSACAANIEFTPQGDTITRYDGSEENITGYLFQSKTWPRSCSIEFEADAFQGASDTRPVRYYYKGYFRRKMADKSVIKIVGKIYEVKKKFWKGKNGPGVAGAEVGSFVARKRMQAINNELDEEYDDEYDDYDDYDEDLYDDNYDN